MPAMGTITILTGILPGLVAFIILYFTVIKKRQNKAFEMLTKEFEGNCMIIQ